MSYNLPDDWYVEPTGESLILDQEKVARGIERLRASEMAWKLIAKYNDRWNALPQTEKEAVLQKALESEVADGCAMTAEIERLLAKLRRLLEKHGEQATADVLADHEQVAVGDKS